MGKPRIYRSGDQRSQGDSNRRDKYLELSLQGKWLAVANAWLEDNCPCSVEMYFLNVMYLMPTHINDFRGKRNPQLSMAKHALSRLVKGYPSKSQHPFVDIIDGRIEYRARTSVRYDYSWIPIDPVVGMEIDFGSMNKTGKERDAAMNQLRRCGFKWAGKGVFRYDPQPNRRLPSRRNSK